MSKIPRPKPLRAKLPGSEAGPDRNQSRPPKKPAYMQTGSWLRDVGHSAEKSAGHLAHDAKHGVGKVIKSLNPFD